MPCSAASARIARSLFTDMYLRTARAEAVEYMPDSSVKHANVRYAPMVTASACAASSAFRAARGMQNDPPPLVALSASVTYHLFAASWLLYQPVVRGSFSGES